ncbi:MAG TPA: AbrB/MazE/SpoVT family DNA-binding domain-containing protein [Candidatus Acetothermia bacterium]|nr:AbrB/MazE/SpoVT family DNA-binding domain-containing protein [Candidatus Acetothermia bacterium]
MAIVSLSSKKQITLPAQLVHRWDLKQGDGLVFFEDGDSVRVLPIKRKSLLEMRGSVKAKQPIKDIDELRQVAREEHSSRHERKTG